ncbi:EamA-like transporter family [Seminavis robusta]|uniref:EamA-like transporter family n=1 Tax=Seminavis robusta TaxID=568900 RepID=A0A9N8EQW6_9STRA|nr:EamA-like transporter family [Seminavis robusta]|eukprot:Sro1464_g274930.1 EamA-like transporter family (479) ;mRNA; f:24940-26376
MLIQRAKFVAAAVTSVLLLVPSHGFSLSTRSVVPHPKLAARTFSSLALRATIVEEEEKVETQVELLPPPPQQDDNNSMELEGVVCARGVCVVADDMMAPEICTLDEESQQIVCQVNDDATIRPSLTWTYLWPRALLLVCSVLYGTNFPLGRLMNESLPASAATSSRMVLAAVALSPFLFQLKPSLRSTAALCGTFTALGYISQSIALVDTSAATVSFLGALVVIVCPALAVLVDKRPMGFADAPQTWIAAILCLFGVGVLELGGGGGDGMDAMGWGDVWSILQAVGFGTSFYITERMMAKEPSQALPITAMQCAMAAAFSGLWAVADGSGFCGPDGPLALFGSPYGSWLTESDQPFTLPALFLNVDFRMVALAAAFTGFITTAGNRVGETLALGKLSSSEASVLLATEPLWAALFANFLIGEKLSLWDGVGGAIIVASCVATALDPTWLRELLNIDYDNNNDNDNKQEAVDTEASMAP